MNMYLNTINPNQDAENPRKAEKQRLVHVKARKRQTPRLIKTIAMFLTSHR